MSVGEKPRKKRQPRARPAPLFIGKAELAHHMTVDPSTIDAFIADGTVPPPHSRPGERTVLWLRRHFDAYVESGRWPREAFSRDR